MTLDRNLLLNYFVGDELTGLGDLLAVDDPLAPYFLGNDLALSVDEPRLPQMVSHKRLAEVALQIGIREAVVLRDRS